MDYCECITNSELGKNLLNFIKRYTRQYCTDNECPVDGNRPDNQDTQNQQFQTIVLFVLLFSIFMSMMTSNRNRNRDRDAANEKASIRASHNGNDRDDGNGGPPPAVN